MERNQADIYSCYEDRLRQLLKQLGQDHSRYTEALTYQQRLQENIAQSRQFGDNEIRRTGRAEIIKGLNELALSELGMPFNELSGLSTSNGEQKLAAVELEIAPNSLTIQIVLAGQSADWASQERQRLLVEALAEVLHIGSTGIESLDSTGGSCVVTLRLPKDVACQLLGSEATPLLRTVENTFIAKARERQVEPGHCRIIRVYRSEPGAPPYQLDFANRERELQDLLNPGSEYYIEISAPAGYGKTYLLNKLAERFTAESWRVVRLNLNQAIAPQTGEEALAEIGQQLNQPDIGTIDRLAQYIFREGLRLVFLLDGTERASSSFSAWLVDILLPQLEAHRLPPIEPQRVIAVGRHRVDKWHQLGQPRFELRSLSPFHAGIIQTVLTEQVRKRSDLHVQPQPDWYRDMARDIFDLSKGHPLCICNVIRWLDARNFAVPSPVFQRDRGRIFGEQVRPVVEEHILGHVTERDTLELVCLFCVLRGYNPNIIHWLATRITSTNQVISNELKEILIRSIHNSLGTLGKLNATQLDGSLDTRRDIYRFDAMIRQLISLQVELENPPLFWQIHRWAADMYDYWIAGMNQPNEPLPIPPADSVQAAYMVEALYHHARLMHYQRVAQGEAEEQLAQYVQRYCGQARSSAGWAGQTVQQFIDLVNVDEELIHFLELAAGRDRLGTVMALAYAASQIEGPSS